MPIAHANSIHVDERLRSLGDRHRGVCASLDATALGIGAVVMYLVFGPEDGTMFADNVSAVA